MSKFIICPDCNAESNHQVDVTCGTCGCAGIIPKPNPLCPICHLTPPKGGCIHHGKEMMELINSSPCA